MSNLSEEEKGKRWKIAGKRCHNFTEKEKEKKRYENLSKKQKMKQAQYRRNYYLKHKKNLFRYFADFLKMLGQLKNHV